MIPVIVIDPGHGGDNHGCAVGARAEKDVTLEIAKELASTMQGVNAATFLTRYRDDPLSQQQRGMISDLHGAGLVLSIHVNAHPALGDAAHGIELYHWPGSNLARVVAITMMECAPLVLRPGRVIECTDPKRSTPGVRAICGAHKAPVVLAEVCYSTAHRDLRFLNDEWGRAQIVTALRMGVCKALELLCRPAY